MRRRFRAGRLLAGVAAGVLIAATAAVALAGPAAADETTVSVDTCRTGWDQNEPGLGPSAVSASDFGQLFSTDPQRPGVRPADRRRRHADRGDREQLDLRDEPGDRRHHLVAQRRAGLAGVHSRLRRPGTEHRHHQHAGLRPGDQRGLLHGQGQRRYATPRTRTSTCTRSTRPPASSAPAGRSPSRARRATTRPTRSTRRPPRSARACCCSTAWSTPGSPATATTAPTSATSPA